MNLLHLARSPRLWACILSASGAVRAQTVTWLRYLVYTPTPGSAGGSSPVIGTPFTPIPSSTPPVWTGALTSIPPNFGNSIANATDGAGNIYTIYTNYPIPFPPSYQGFVSRTTSGVTTYFGLSFAPLGLAVNAGGDVFIMSLTSGNYTVNQLKPDGSISVVGSFSSGGTNAGTLTVDPSGNPEAPVATLALGGAGYTVATYLFVAEVPVPDLVAPLAAVSVPFSSNPTVTLNGSAFSTLPISYQWSYDDVPIPGATGAIYTGTVTASGTYSVLATTSAGSVTSQAAVTLTVDFAPVSTAPVFLTNPASITIPLGSSTTLTAAAAATLPIFFQWYLNGAPIPGANQGVAASNFGEFNTSFTTNQPGSYEAVAATSGAGGSSVMSVAATVTVRDQGGISALPTPTITLQPQSVAYAFGRGATLTTSSVATLPTTYQWQLNGVNLAGANMPTFQTNLLGTYDVVATTSAGSVASAPAVVALANRPVNISSRAFVGTGANLAIAGFVISSYSGGTKRVLVRAAGPGLTPLGVAGALARPVLSVFDSNNQPLATNAGWNNSADIAAASTVTGAFPFAANSADSALILDLAPGNYTAQVSGVNGTTGIALVEVYELAPDNGHFVNISTRAFVGSDAAILIGGLVVAGTQPSPVLIRAIGPGLARFNLPGLLTQPILSVYNNSTGQLIAVNVGWSNGSSADAVAEAAAASATGGFALTPGSADCAALLTLAPGVYTAQVTGANGTTGIALIEAYQVPQ
jgi:hypothetical protein